MKSYKKLLRKHPRLEEFISASFSELDKLFDLGLLSEEEILLFQNDYFYFLYTQRNYSQEYTLYECIPGNNISWKQLVKRKEILKLPGLDELLSNPISELDQILLFQDDYLYFLYAQRNYNYPASFENLPPKFTTWKQLVKRQEELKEFQKNLFDPNLPKDIRLMVLLHLSYPELISFCYRNKSDSLCSDENSELWKTLYYQHISVVPLRFNEFVYYYGRSIAFFKENSILHEKLKGKGKKFDKVSYKLIYSLFINNNDFFLPANLGSEKVLNFEKLSIEDDEDAEDIVNFFITAVQNNHMHFVNLILPLYLKIGEAENLARHKIIINKLIERGFYEMIKYLHELNLGFVYDSESYQDELFEFYKDSEVSSLKAFRFIVEHLLSPDQRLDIFERFVGFHEFRPDNLDFILSVDKIDLTTMQEELFNLVPPSVERYQWILDRIKLDRDVLHSLLKRMQRQLEAYKRAKKSLKDIENFKNIIRLLYEYDEV